MSAAVEIDTQLVKDRIIKWLKADTEIYDKNNPDSNLVEGQVSAKALDIIFGVPEEEHWNSKPAPFISVSNADNFVSTDDFFGSVVNDILTSSYERLNFVVAFVVQASDAETTERLIDSLHQKIKARLKSNVQLKDVVTDTNDPDFGKLVAGTEICATSKCGVTNAIQNPTLNRRLFAYGIAFQIEVQIGLD